MKIFHERMQLFKSFFSLRFIEFKIRTMKITTFLVALCFTSLTMNAFGQIQKQHYTTLDDRSLEIAIKTNIQAEKPTFNNLFHLVTLTFDQLTDDEFKRITEHLKNNPSILIQSQNREKQIFVFALHMEFTSLSENELLKRVFQVDEKLSKLIIIDIKNVKGDE